MTPLHRSRVFALNSWSPVHLEAEANDLRRLLGQAVDRTDPTVVIHGHWHQRNLEMINRNTAVFGLNCNMQRGFAATISLEPKLSVDYVQQLETRIRARRVLTPNSQRRPHGRIGAAEFGFHQWKLTHHAFEVKPIACSCSTPKTDLQVSC